MKAFVAVPFSADSSVVYEAIRAAAAAENIELVCWDEEISGGGPGSVLRAIQRSEFVIADVSENNPNVLYELGYADAIQKPTILIRSLEEAASFPADLVGNPFLPYDPARLDKLVHDLRRRFRDQMEATAQVA